MSSINLKVPATCEKRFGMWEVFVLNGLKMCGLFRDKNKKVAVETATKAIHEVLENSTQTAHVWSANEKALFLVCWRGGWGYDIYFPGDRVSRTQCGNSFEEAKAKAEAHAAQYVREE